MRVERQVGEIENIAKFNVDPKTYHHYSE
jgi:hypothetical protein